MFRLAEPPLFTRLRPAENILIAGAGGGFDIYSGLPIALALHGMGKRVHLANLAFSDLSRLASGDWVGPGVAEVHPDSVGNDEYFPERTLARWLPATGLAPRVYAFPKAGVRRLRAAYQVLVSQLDLDAVVLVDGGTDILLRGDESGLGTPEEDMTSLAAVAGLDDGVDRLVACLGFGIDAYHGVCHAHVLENIAALERAGAYLGAFSVPADSQEGAAYLAAVAHAAEQTTTRPSIVNGQIAAAIRGEFGDVHASSRTRGSELFVNPLMGLYFTFDLLGLASGVDYLALLEHTEHAHQVALVIRAHLKDRARPRPRRSLPH
ncbi:DUF1152 domain-containing protein [Goodfellowiella coeruleoviolacea]|uniref:DUF1152 domain-containing protein n=1 Tax=Goodfellowiella coeruleoviolacea TaxID=334858 RepID=A0AAE3GJR6_9PSEU|nr:DUF1152 domain-containing protein [Goodfellowiella coeruleoviolacea]MCP2168549.1 hypothetical protein [Goodfellowiella coeruleoviolacea]